MEKNRTWWWDREKILQITIPEKKFPASSKSPLMLVSLRMVQQPTSFGIVKMEGKLVLALPKPELQLHYFTLRTDGSLLASRLAKTVHDEFKIKPAKVILWTDSMIVLAWLRSESALLKPLVFEWQRSRQLGTPAPGNTFRRSWTPVRGLGGQVVSALAFHL